MVQSEDQKSDLTKEVFLATHNDKVSQKLKLFQLTQSKGRLIYI